MSEQIGNERQNEPTIHAKLGALAKAVQPKLMLSGFEEALGEEQALQSSSVCGLGGRDKPQNKGRSKRQSATLVCRLHV